MIELFLPSEAAEAGWVEAALKDMVVGYERVELAPDEVETALGMQVALPAIRHDARIISGQEDLMAYLQELEHLVEDWRRFQSDACYIDEDGEVC